MTTVTRTPGSTPGELRADLVVGRLQARCRALGLPAGPTVEDRRAQEARAAFRVICGGLDEGERDEGS